MNWSPSCFTLVLEPTPSKRRPQDRPADPAQKGGRKRRSVLCEPGAQRQRSELPVRRFAWLRIGLVPAGPTFSGPSPITVSLSTVGANSWVWPRISSRVTSCPVCTAFDPSRERGWPRRPDAPRCKACPCGSRRSGGPIRAGTGFSQAAGRPVSGPTQPCCCPCKSATSPECQWWRCASVCRTTEASDGRLGASV